ncbi:MAG: HAD family hydrolase [Actinomycetota bacterium]|nr:HAD family hydrolase [Actinomycetota bacterium]
MSQLALPADFFPELIALDIDDTLTEHLGNVSERVIDAVAAVRAAGVQVVLATGRSLSTTAPVGRALGLDGWAVCSNGAVLATIEPQTVIEAVTFDPKPVLDQLVERLPDAIYAVEDAHGIFLTTRTFGADALGMSIREVAFEHLTVNPVVRLVVRSEDHREDGFGEIVKQMGLHSVIFGIGDLAWMDIGPVGVNKATMLANLCTRLDINQANTLAIGDFTNDIEMLRWAGVGVAMGSASAAVMAAADTVTSSTPGIGVAEVLDALLA